MCSVIQDGSMRLSFYVQAEALVCEVQDASTDDGVGRLPCRMSSLVGVLGGLRYHFGGGGVLCSISRDGDLVTIEAQLASARRPGASCFQ